MNIQILHTFSEEILPHGSLSLGTFEHAYILLETKDSLGFYNTNEYVALDSGIFLCGSKIKLSNISGKKSVKLGGIVFLNVNRKTRIPPRITLLHDEYQLQLARRILYIKESVEHPQQTHKDLCTIISLNNSESSNSTLASYIDSRLIRINRYIRKNYAQPLTLVFLAEMIGCTPVYLSNTYSRVFKVPPIKHIQMIRMKMARELLIENDLTIKEIARSLGYISSSQFSVIFKRYYCSTPLEFRISNNRKARSEIPAE